MIQTAHILVVDDDWHARAQLQCCLQSSGYRVTAVTGGHGMQRVLEKKRVDLIVLDVQLPGEDGLALCRDLRSRSQLPLMIVSALADETDRIIGLELGADDYLPKPFNPRELTSRVKSILRRTLRGSREHVPLSAAAFVFGEWTLLPIQRELEHADGTRAALTGAEFRLLMQLLIEAPRPVSRSCLFERLCDREFDPADRRIDVRVSRLRQLLRDDARSPSIIKTLHGRGYALSVAVKRPSHDATEQAARPAGWALRSELQRIGPVPMG